MKARNGQLGRPDPSPALVAIQAAIFREASVNKGPLTSLLGRVLQRGNLQAAWQRVSSTAGARTPGPDWVTPADVIPKLAAWLDQLAEEVKVGRYQPLPPRWISVPKRSDPTKSRRLGVLCLRDRVVHTAVKQIIEPILEPRFSPTSFGFRPGRSVTSALLRATQLLSQGHLDKVAFPLALHLDIADCFDSIDCRILLESLAGQLADSNLLDLLHRLLDAGSRTAGWLWSRRHRGIVQGSSLSPLLCNLYLHPLDEALRQLTSTSEGRVQALRYADDVLVLAADRSLARQAVRLVRRTLGSLRLSLRLLRPKVCDVRNGVDWLGVRIQARTGSWDGRVTFGYFIPDPKVTQMLQTLDELTTPPHDRAWGRSLDLTGWLGCLNDELRQWRQAYQFADNAPDVFRVLDEFAGRRVGEMLSRVKGLSRSRTASAYRRRLPRGFWTWQVKDVRLLVLSAEPPQAPIPRIRRPVWMTGRVADPGPKVGGPRAVPK